MGWVPYYDGRHIILRYHFSLTAMTHAKSLKTWPTLLQATAESALHFLLLYYVSLIVVTAVIRVFLCNLVVVLISKAKYPRAYIIQDVNTANSERALI